MYMYREGHGVPLNLFYGGNQHDRQGILQNKRSYPGAYAGAQHIRQLRKGHCIHKARSAAYHPDGTYDKYIDPIYIKV